MLPPGTSILQVLPRLEIGGVERGAVEIAQAVAEAGGTSLVTSAGGRLVPYVARAGGRHITLPLQSKSLFRMWRNTRALARLIRRESVGIVHARSRAPAWSAWRAAKREGAHFVTTYHGIYGEGVPGKRAYNAIMARGERVIAASRFVEQLLIDRHGVDPAIIRVIPRGVDLTAFDPALVGRGRVARLAEAWRLPDGAPTIMLPGRLSRWKGQDVLIEALALLPRKDVVCILVGSVDGRERFVRELERRATRLGVVDRLRFAGQCDDMASAYMLADVVVSASTEPEAFGRVVIEAQAMARPVIATDHGGAAETVEHNLTGWRVPPGHAGALAQTLDYALHLTPEEREQLGAQARASVAEHFSVQVMQQATLDVYRELIG